MATISVIIPVFNGERTIQETVESVLNQTFSDFELIIINDGSQDKTLTIVQEFNDSRISIFSYQNAGLAASRNRGIENATGEYISFIDADDLWTSDKLEAQYHALQSNPDAAVAYSWTNCIDEQSQFLRRGYYLSFSGEVCQYLLLTNFLENGSNPLIRHQALKTVGGFDESLKSSEDWEMYLRLAFKYSFVAVSSPQILYRISVGSMSTNTAKMEVETVKVIDRVFNQAPESLCYLKRYSLSNLYKILLYRSLEGSPQKNKSLFALRYLGLAIRYDLFSFRGAVLGKVCLRLLVVMTLPARYVQGAIAKLGKFCDILTLLGYLRLEP
ncbi:MAG: glycosyltransferase [Leptolyngbyaceae cyanobacterium MO_188.B28]|nr:glycosyltransferase [Leptolyngbyaceae cyanobacterium MO_188.B28]